MRTFFFTDRSATYLPQLSPRLIRVQPFTAAPLLRRPGERGEHPSCFDLLFQAFQSCGSIYRYFQKYGLDVFHIVYIFYMQFNPSLREKSSGNYHDGQLAGCMVLPSCIFYTKCHRKMDASKRWEKKGILTATDTSSITYLRTWEPIFFKPYGIILRNWAPSHHLYWYTLKNNPHVLSFRQATSGLGK